MKRVHFIGRRTAIGLAVALLGLLTVASAPAVSGAAETKTSLDLVPADAHIYGSLLRTREQIEIVAKSNWWARLTAMPAAQMAWAEISRGLELDDAAEFFAQPENKDAADVLLEMVSDEIFVYGDKRLADLMQVYKNVGISSFGGAFLMSYNVKRSFSDGPPGEFNEAAFRQAQQAQMRLIFMPIVESLDKIQVPQVVIGFKVKDTAKAQAQAKRLGELVKGAIAAEAPELSARLKEVKIAGSTFWTFDFDGGLLPPDDPPLDMFGDDAEKYKKIFDHVRKLKGVISLGVHKGYVLLSVGPTTEHLATLGEGKLLADVAEMAPLKKLMDRPITSMGYASRDFMAAAAWNAADIDRLAKSAKELVTLAELEDMGLQKQITADIDELAKDIKPFIPEPGALVGVSFLTNRGYEGYQYDYGQNLYYDESKPLSILEHVGGSPLVMFAGRAKSSPDFYPVLVKWIGKGYGYVERYVVPTMSPAEQAHFKSATEKFLPLAKRLDLVVTKMLKPALADGQSALVIDGKLASQQWIRFMPPAAKPLVLPQPAMIFGVTKPELIKQAADETRAIINEALAAARELAPDEFPDLKLEEPKSREFEGAGTIYWHTLPENWGLDKRLAPNYGLSENFAAVSMAPKVTLDLLKPTPLKLPGPLAKTDRPLAAATHVDIAGLVDAATPWIMMAMQAVTQLRSAPPAFDDPKGAPDAAPPGAAPGEAPPDPPKIDKFKTAVAAQDEDLPMHVDEETTLIFSTVYQVTELLKAMRSYTSATYVEGKALVTHSELHIKDVPAVTPGPGPKPKDE